MPTTGMSGKTYRRTSPKGWRHTLYAFGPWAIGAALLLFSILVVAYENRYHGAVRQEIRTRLVSKQETMALLAAHRLREYLDDVTAKLRLVARLVGHDGLESVPPRMLERLIRHDTERIQVAGLYVVDRGFLPDRMPRYAFSPHDGTFERGDPARHLESPTEERVEMVRHLTVYEENPDTLWLVGESLDLTSGGRGQVLTVPVRDADGRLTGLVAAVLPTALVIDRFERASSDGGPALWTLTAGGDLLGDRFGPAPNAAEVTRVATAGGLTTVQTDAWVMTVAPICYLGERPWTLVAARPAYEIERAVHAGVGGPWTHNMLLSLAFGNFLGLCVLLTLRHWREQITVLRAEAEHDALTNAYSRRFLDHEAAMLCRRVSNLGVLMIDLNDFKRHNDTLGHYIGDQMLKATADLLKSATRDQDFVIRMGGDEFLLLLPQADERLVALVASRVRDAVRVWNLSGPLPGAHLSFAMGGAAGQSRHLDYLIKQADERMYADKTRFKKDGVKTQTLWTAANPN